MIEFFIPGDCVPWARAGGGKTGRRFTPSKQANYMTSLRLVCQAAMNGQPPMEGPIALTIHARYLWPKSISPKKRALPGAIWRTGRPDADNLSKIVGDALNRVAWADDAQIAVSHVQKFYSDQPGLSVKIEAL